MNDFPWFKALALIGVYGGLFYLWYSLKTKKGLGAWLSRNKDKGDIKWIETQAIAPRTSLVLVEVRGKPMIVLLSPHGVQLRPLETSENFEDNLAVATKVEPSLPERLPAHK